MPVSRGYVAPANVRAACALRELTRANGVIDSLSFVSEVSLVNNVFIELPSFRAD